MDISLFGFDLDVLELRLHELDIVVDLFAVIEMPLTHKGEVKPLIWARNKDTPRFAERARDTRRRWAPHARGRMGCTGAAHV